MFFLKILLLEDDVILSEVLEDFLLSQNYKVVTVYNADEAEDYVYSDKFDLLLLDVNIPYGNGFDILKRLREIGNNTPAIFITSLNTTLDLEEGYSAGCNDYIKKPFELKELEMRINYIKTTYNLANDSLYIVNDELTLDMSNLAVIKENKRIYLPKKEALILKYFVQNKNKIIDMDELVINVWEYDNGPSIATIRTYLKNIRKIVGSKYFTTIKGSGYRFNDIAPQ